MRFRLILLYVIAFVGCRHAVLSWVGGFAPRRASTGHRGFLIPSHATLKQGDLITYSGPGNPCMRNGENLRVGDRGIVLEVMEKHNSIKVQWSSHHDYLWNVRSASVRKQGHALGVIKEFEDLNINKIGKLTLADWNSDAVAEGFTAKVLKQINSQQSPTLVGDLDNAIYWYDEGVNILSKNVGTYISNKGSVPAGDKAQRLIQTRSMVPVEDSDARKRKLSHMKGIAEKAERGVLTPLVDFARVVLGEDTVLELRMWWIQNHVVMISNVICPESKQSPFGKFLFQQLFRSCDSNNDGMISKPELKKAMHSLGFDFLTEQKVDKLFLKADEDGNDLIDLQEFMKVSPGALRKNLAKLAAKNGKNWGLLA